MAWYGLGFECEAKATHPSGQAYGQRLALMVCACGIGPIDIFNVNI